MRQKLSLYDVGLDHSTELCASFYNMSVELKLSDEQHGALCRVADGCRREIVPMIFAGMRPVTAGWDAGLTPGGCATNPLAAVIQLYSILACVLWLLRDQDAARASRERLERELNGVYTLSDGRLLWGSDVLRRAMYFAENVKSHRCADSALSAELEACDREITIAPNWRHGVIHDAWIAGCVARIRDVDDRMYEDACATGPPSLRLLTVGPLIRLLDCALLTRIGDYERHVWGLVVRGRRLPGTVDMGVLERIEQRGWRFCRKEVVSLCGMLGCVVPDWPCG